MLEGQKVIVRSSPSGCWYGELVERDGNAVTLRNARRLWRWWAADGVSLSGVATAGVIADKSKIEPAVSTVIVLEVCELLAVTSIAQDSIEGA